MDYVSKSLKETWLVDQADRSLISVERKRNLVDQRLVTTAQLDWHEVDKNRTVVDKTLVRRTMIRCLKPRI